MCMRVLLGESAVTVANRARWRAVTKTVRHYRDGGSMRGDPMATSIRTGESSDTSWWRRAAVYRAALRVRRTHPALGDGTLEWIDAGPDVVAFRREPGSECWINLGADPVPMPQGQVLVASAEAHAGTIPTDVAVWLQIG